MTTHPRPGKVLVLFVLTLTALLGMAGLVIDGGMMRTGHRNVQNVADSAALAAAMDLMRGATLATATTTATTFVQTHNGMTDATVTVTSPPAAGPYAGSVKHVEVVVTRPAAVVFMQAAGLGGPQQVSARAVAGFEPLASGEGAILLDPTAAPGLSFSGANSRLKVKGSVVVNAQANGWDQYGQPVPANSTPTAPYALATSPTAVPNPAQAPLQARAVRVVGGVDTPENVRDYDDPINNPSPLSARGSVSADPLRTLPVPTPVNTPSITDWTRQSIGPINNSSVTLNPGVYDDITINSGIVTFNPGVYILSPTGPGQGLTINNGTVSGNGVMFYLTGSNYLDTSPGYWDALDGPYDGPLPPTNGTLPPDPYPGAVNYASLTIVPGPAINLRGLAFDPGNPSDRFLIYQRRRNTSPASIGGSEPGNAGFSLKGTIYAKWANYTLNGGSRYDTQFVVGSLAIKGGVTMTITGTGVNRGLVTQVYLVE